MSPELQAAIKAGVPLTRPQFKEYIDCEAKSASIRGGADEAIKRAQEGAEPRNYREMKLRLSIGTYLRS